MSPSGRFSYLLLVAAIVSCQAVLAQQTEARLVTGTVFDANGQSLPGVTGNRKY
jgi:hypothetical protein